MQHDEHVTAAMASYSVKRLNFRELQLVFEVLVLLSASYYDHNFSENDYIGNLGIYQQQCVTATKQGPTSAAILGLKAVSAFQPKNFKRKFFHSVMKYTTNGVSTFNPRILELEIFKACDVKTRMTRQSICPRYVYQEKVSD